MWMRRLISLLGGLCLVLAGCAAVPPAGPGKVTGSRTLTVFAAASLTDAFTALGQQFETENPGVTVTFNYAGSADLAQQIVHGAPADVFAAASDSTMKMVTDSGLAATAPTVFASNVLQIATPSGNPNHIASFADLARPGLVVVMAAPQVPCGAAVQKIERATGVRLQPVSEESDVKSVLSKVLTGDADAGLVYVTDVAAAKGKVDGVSFPEAKGARTHYPITVLKNAPEPELAVRFQRLVTGESGQKALHAAGFGT